MSPRSDALRNRATLVEAAKRVFAAGGDIGPEAVAREAGVGVGTLYRHFPDRNDLAAAVYEDELVQVATRAHQLLEESAPPIALRAWMDRFATRFENKRMMAPALQSLIGSGAVTAGSTRATLGAAAQEILDAGLASGDFRAEANGDDLVVALVGVCMATASDDDSAQLGRLFDLLVGSVSTGVR